VLSQEQMNSQSPSSYAVVKQKSSKESVRMQLPLRVGTSPHADIIVNSQALLPCSYVIDNTDQAMTIVAQKDGSLISPSEMNRFGLSIKGPFPGTAVDKPSLKQRLAEWIFLENLWFSKLPQNARNALGGSLPQKARLSSWATVAICTFALSFWLLGRQNTTQDFSSVPFALSVGVINKSLFGASPSRFGYEKGVLFHLSGMVPNQKTQLRFDVGGLDEDKEIEVVFNGASLFVSKADIACVELFCSRSLTLPIWEGGAAELFFKHNGSGTWLVKNVLVQQIPVITTAERSMVTRWLDAARRAWEDRNVSAENIVMASELISKAEELVNARDGSENLQTEVQVLKKEVTSSFDEIVNDLTFKARRDLKLGDVEGARKSLLIMLRLYPDPAHKEHQRISKLIKETEGVQ
jgi:hypothetical protein